MISYRANIMAMAACHVDCLVGIGAVGSLKKSIRPGDLVIPDDFFDATHDRQVSFFDTKRVHVDMSEPFCPVFREDLISIANHVDKEHLHEGGVYVSTEGPRLETAAEVRFYASVGDVVGMTLVPEVVLAREKGLCYASLCVVCNMATGMQMKLPAQEIRELFDEKKPILKKILLNLIQIGRQDRVCSCRKTVEDSTL
jgi:5'-methylthioadenosine phosphorylase